MNHWLDTVLTGFAVTGIALVLMLLVYLTILGIIRDDPWDE